MHTTPAASAASPSPAAAATSIKYSLDVHQVLAAVRLQVDHDADLRKRVLLYRWGLPALVILTAWIAVALGSSPVWLIGAGLIALFFFLSMGSATRAGIARAIERRFKSGSPRGIVGDHEMRITDAALVERTEFNESAHAWDGLDRVLDTGDCLFVYVTPFSAHIVPREAVLEGDYHAFVSAMEAHMSVQRVSPGESFERAKAAGQDPKPQRNPPRALAAFAVGLAVTVLWSAAAAQWIATWVLPGNWPEQLWWLTYNVFVTLPGLSVGVVLASRWSQRDRESLCRRCGHWLRGLSQPQCPECGEHI